MWSLVVAGSVASKGVVVVVVGAELRGFECRVINYLVFATRAKSCKDYNNTNRGEGSQGAGLQAEV